jgi:hypothetical protein
MIRSPVRLRDSARPGPCGVQRGCPVRAAVGGYHRAAKRVGAWLAVAGFTVAAARAVTRIVTRIVGR